MFGEDACVVLVDDTSHIEHAAIVGLHGILVETFCLTCFSVGNVLIRLTPFLPMFLTFLLSGGLNHVIFRRASSCRRLADICSRIFGGSFWMLV